MPDWTYTGHNLCEMGRRWIYIYWVCFIFYSESNPPKQKIVKYGSTINFLGNLGATRLAILYVAIWVANVLDI